MPEMFRGEFFTQVSPSVPEIFKGDFFHLSRTMLEILRDDFSTQVGPSVPEIFKDELFVQVGPFVPGAILALRYF